MKTNDSTINAVLAYHLVELAKGLIGKAERSEVLQGCPPSPMGSAPERSGGGWRWDEAGLALAIVFLYAASDELHQAFVPTRTALVSDVFIDTAGGAAGLLALWLARRIFQRA